MRSLLDTNVLIYADAADEPAKQRQAVGLISELRRTGDAVLSTQVLQEYVNVALRKLRLLRGRSALAKNGAWSCSRCHVGQAIGRSTQENLLLRVKTVITRNQIIF